MPVMPAGESLHAAVGAHMSQITVLLGCLLCASCANVPVFDETLGGTHSKAEIEIMGARGPLSKKQSKTVLTRLMAQAPDRQTIRS